MNIQITLLTAAVALSACGSDGGGSSFTFENSNLSGTTYQGSGVTAQNGTTTAATSFDATNATLVFTPNENGGTGENAYTSARFDIDTGGYVFFPNSINSAASLSDEEAIAFGPSIADGPNTNDTLFVTLITFEGIQSKELGVYVLGNETAAAALPNGIVTYQGSAAIFDTTNPLDISSGLMFADVDFTNGDMTAAGIVASDGALNGTRFAVVPTALSGAGFESTLTSTDVTINASAIEGRFFGANGGELAGTLYVATPTDNFVGMYGAVD